jgi:hypothetical protein
MAKNLVIVIREVFYFLSALLALFVVLEIISPNIILAYFNLNYLFILWLADGWLLLSKS